ncbi:hypothetical protein BH20ACT23_BH20ACT23_02480 [soil metagenome]
MRCANQELRRSGVSEKGKVLSSVFQPLDRHGLRTPKDDKVASLRSCRPFPVAVVAHPGWFRLDPSTSLSTSLHPWVAALEGKENECDSRSSHHGDLCWGFDRFSSNEQRQTNSPIPPGRCQHVKALRRAICATQVSVDRGRHASARDQSPLAFFVSPPKQRFGPAGQLFQTYESSRHRYVDLMCQVSDGGKVVDSAHIALSHPCRRPRKTPQRRPRKSPLTAIRNPH